MSIVGIESNLQHALCRHAVIMTELFAVIHEIECFEVALENAKREPGDTRPPENAGDPNCVHELDGDVVNAQYFCTKCPKRFNLDYGMSSAQLLSQEEASSLMRGVCIDASRENINALNFLGSDTHPTFDPDFPFGPEVFLSTKPMTDAEYFSQHEVDGLMKGGVAGFSTPDWEQNLAVFDPDSHGVANPSVFSAGWESVKTGGYTPLLSLALDDAVATFCTGNTTPEDPAFAAEMEKMRKDSESDLRANDWVKQG